MTMCGEHAYAAAAKAWHPAIGFLDAPGAATDKKVAARICWAD
jgi:hypothetical protein